MVVGWVSGVLSMMYQITKTAARPERAWRAVDDQQRFARPGAGTGTARVNQHTGHAQNGQAGRGSGCGQTGNGGSANGPSSGGPARSRPASLGEVVK